jgi:cysteine desulfurase / selenocysteine lyase
MPPLLPLDRDWSDQFPILNRMVFFNHAAVAPLCKPAADALRTYAAQAEQAANVASHWYRRAAEVKVLAARLINAAGPDEIAFVPNTSSGLSLVAKGLRWARGDEVVITQVEYPANRYPWHDLQRLGVKVVAASIPKT